MNHTTDSRPDFFPDLFKQVMLILVLAIVLLNISNAICIASRPWVTHPNHILMLGTEQSPAAWISSTLLLVGSILCMCCRTTAIQRNRGWWLFMAMLVLAMSIDETANLHTRVGQYLGRHGKTDISYGWVIPTIAGLLVALLMSRFIRRLPRFARIGFSTAFIVFILSASGLDLLGGLLANQYGQQTYLDYILETLEENGEMLGELILLFTLARLCRERGFRLYLGSPPAAGKAPPAAV